MRFIVQILSNGLAILLADYLTEDIIFTGNVLTLLIAGLILGLINFFFRPILKLISLPLIALTLGIFIIVINMGLLWLLNYLVPELTIKGFSAYFWGTIIISAVNIFVGLTIKKKV